LLAAQERQQKLDKLLAASATIIAQPMTYERIDQAVQALANIRAEFPASAEATKQMGDLITAIAVEARRLSQGENEDIGLQLLEKGLGHFVDNPELRSVQASLVQQREIRVAEEQALREATMGRLAIDAVPWGEVIQIVDKSGQPQPLPTVNSTPVVFSLPAGEYTVSIRNEPNGQPEQVSVSVIAQQVELLIHPFNSLTADEYFDRSGW